MFARQGAGDIISPPDPNRSFTLSRAELGVFNRPYFTLFWHLTVMLDLAKTLSQEQERANSALRALNKMINTINPFDASTWPPGKFCDTESRLDISKC